jgi:hypothetical protein
MRPLLSALLYGMALGCASGGSSLTYAAPSLRTPCAPPDSSTAPSWFWDSTYAFGALSEFGSAQSGTIRLDARDFRPASAATARAYIGAYSLGLVYLTPSGPSAPEHYLIVLRHPKRRELLAIVGDDPQGWGPGVLIGAITPNDAINLTEGSPRHVEAMVWASGLELALGTGLFGEDGPPRLLAVSSDPLDVRGWFTPGASVTPPPHGYFCLVRLRPA